MRLWVPILIRMRPRVRGIRIYCSGLSLGLHPNIGFEPRVVDHPQGRVVLFEINPAWGRPVQFYGKAYIRVGSSKTELSKHPDKEHAIWTRRTDWSAQVCERATLADLDPAAIGKAREQFKIKHPAQSSEVDGWDDETFLNKARLTIHGGVTNSALLLLGSPSPRLCFLRQLPKSHGF